MFIGRLLETSYLEEMQHYYFNHVQIDNFHSYLHLFQDAQEAVKAVEEAKKKAEEAKKEQERKLEEQECTTEKL